MFRGTADAALISNGEAASLFLAPLAPFSKFSSVPSSSNSTSSRFALASFLSWDGFPGLCFLLDSSPSSWHARLQMDEIGSVLWAAVERGVAIGSRTGWRGFGASDTASLSGVWIAQIRRMLRSSGNRRQYDARPDELIASLTLSSAVVGEFFLWVRWTGGFLGTAVRFALIALLKSMSTIRKAKHSRHSGVRFI